MALLNTADVSNDVTITAADTKSEIAAVQDMMRAMVDWLFVRHHAYRELVSRYFDPEEFEADLSALPGEFAGPTGALLVAKVGDEFAGCVGLRRLDETSCEMKRMYVDPRFHRRGLGEALAKTLISRAQQLGYRHMRLDTGPEQHEARALYKKLGFNEIEPYTDLSQEMCDWLTFMEKDLSF